MTAFAILKETGEEVSVTCDMAMATAEGWTKNPKYRSMPEVMLRYRSAAFLVRFYAPDVMLGYQTVEEVEDVQIAAEPAAPLSAAMLAAPVDDEAHDTETGEIVQEGPADEQRGEAHSDAVTLQSAMAEIDACETVIDVDRKVQELALMLSEDDGDELYVHAGVRKTELGAKK